MKIYTIKDEHGKLFPKAILELSNISECIVDGKIALVDYGLESVTKWLQSKEGKGFSLAVCSISITR